ncbi:MAG: efflux RND transporter periplasmic adaptor subunit [Labilibaculum sp.]|nr:efflux RND transporter periplasmic adaptor subunit [Labilibaculum sp.]
MNTRNLLLIMYIITLASCRQKNNYNEETEQYKLLEISLQNISLSTTYSASIRGRQDIKIIPRVDGYLTNTSITEGSKVKKGQTLFIIDQVSYNAELQAAKANVAVGEANVATAELTLSSKQNLYDKNIVSEFELITAENALKTTQAQLGQAKAQETFAQNNLSYTVIKSPSDGVVGKLPYRKGDYVSSAIQDGLTVVADNSQMYVYFSLSERQILDMIQQYQSMDAVITNMPDVQLLLSNQTIYLHKGKVESISGIVDALTGAVSIKAVFPNKEGRLLSGGAGSVIVPYVHTGVIVIPQESTFEIQDKTYVYKVINGEAVSTIIAIDKINNGKEYIVTDGLLSGDIIIAEGAGLVQEGVKVSTVEIKE